MLNKVPSKSILKTPHEMWYGKKPSLSHVRVWGCPAYVKSQEPDKLEARGIGCRFVGYPKNTMGYYFYLPNENKILISRHASFLEKEFIQEEGTGRKIELEELMDEQTSETPDIPIGSRPLITQPPRKSSRLSQPPERYGYLLQDVREMFHLGDNDHVDDYTYLPNRTSF